MPPGMSTGRIILAVLGLAGIACFWVLLGRYQQQRLPWQLPALVGLAVADTLCLGAAFWQTVVNPYAALAKRRAEQVRRRRIEAAAARLQRVEDDAG